MNEYHKLYKITESDAESICEILCRRANEIAAFKSEYMSDKNHLGAVELALTREIDRLRELRDCFDSYDNEDQRTK